MIRSWDPHDVAHPERATWDEYFLALAHTTATRSVCHRSRGGAVIVRDRRIVSTGYVGAPSGHPHCDADTCGAESTRCVAVGAEANALLFCGPNERDGASLYTTRTPDLEAAKLIANSGLSEVVTDAAAADDSWQRVRDLLLRSGVRVRMLAPSRVTLPEAVATRNGNSSNGNGVSSTNGVGAEA